MVGPLLWMALTSLKTTADAESFFNTPRRLAAIFRALFPDPLTWENYRDVFTERPMGWYFPEQYALYTAEARIWVILLLISRLYLC